MEPVKELQGPVEFSRGKAGKRPNAGEVRESVAVGEQGNKSGDQWSASAGDVSDSGDSILNLILNSSRSPRAK
jgi:hypothetical protein